MDPIFRLSPALKRDPAVAAWFADEPPELRAIARKWFTRMRQCGDDVGELVHDGCPVACIGDAPFAYVDAFKAHVNVGFFYGAALDDPAGLLHGAGKHMRHVKLEPGQDLDEAAVGTLVSAAYADLKRRLAQSAN
jgi:hypothetical protein